jgi:tetratricopeptide (TPR) repeat protein
MDSAVTSSPPRRTRRRWRVPPAIMHGPESLESAGVLDEFSGVTALMLWQSLRDVTLWANTPPSERGSLFSASAERNRVALLLTSSVPSELEQPLGMITSMVGRPDKVAAQRVALACRHIAQWAEKHGKLATALTFAQAAALACPGDAAAGYKVGQLARRRAEYSRAETWYRRAIALARQEGDWVSYSLSFLGLGNLYAQRGNLPVARKLHTRGLRASRRHSLRDIQGCAFHDLFTVAIAAGDSEQANTYARCAFDAYGAESVNVPKLAHDVAYFWLTQGFFARSLNVFRALLTHMKHPAELIVVLPNVVRSAAGIGDKVVFDQGWKDVLTLIEIPEVAEHVPEALLELAHGAFSLNEWDRAEDMAERSILAARARREARIELTAEALLDSVRHARLADVRISKRVDSFGSVPTFLDNSDQLAEEFVTCLTARTVSTG